MLAVGSWRTVHAGPTLLAFERAHAGETMLCVFNLGTELVNWSPSEPNAWRLLAAVNGAGDWTFPPFGAVVCLAQRRCVLVP